MTNQVIMYSLLTVMHFTTPEECQMWSDKIRGEGFECFKSYYQKEWYIDEDELPLKRPDIINEVEVSNE
mgnify:CR=1 FL=1|jgi:hypothetical protein|tara:strand:+ start:18363 stop:18569 length:207 start_codon:yes stop_codon:yes gene_type:complete